ncbi:MAG TPA: endolytic transglycosylase MltG [Bacteroidetes bacterium]|nr:endolytic transglycosylase MltG [Bacteroidota bacterium]
MLSRVVGIDSARFVALVHDESFVHSLGINAHSLEGYLLPDTYTFQWQTDEQALITTLVTEYRRFYTDSLQARANGLDWTTNQVMTLASIVEGEAVLQEERPVISGVYHNRLRKGMKLEADPTLRYVIDGGPRRILYSDLQIESPYNTYRYRGLPPGPINNPGRASILAALFPARHNYLFFVANGKGGHWFTSTYAEHMRYVRQYRRERNIREAGSLTDTNGRPAAR